MKMEFQNLELVKNEIRRQFEIKVGEAMAFIEYKETGYKITLLNTQVEPLLDRKKAAAAVIEKTLDYMEKKHCKLVPNCPLVVAYIRRHPAWKRIVMEGHCH